MNGNGLPSIGNPYNGYDIFPPTIGLMIIPEKPRGIQTEFRHVLRP